MYRYSLNCLIVIGLLAGCGSGYTQVDPNRGELRPRRIEASSGGYLIDLPPTGGTHSTQIAGTPQEIFPLLATVYEELGIPIKTIQTSTFLLGNTNFKARKQIDKIAMSRIVDCGSNITGARADHDMITFDLQTQVRAVDPNNVVVETNLIAVARSTQGASTNQVNCASQGALEKRIVTDVQRLLGG